MSADPRSNQHPPQQPVTRPATIPPLPASGRVIQSRDLLAGKAEIFIAHGGDLYRLRVTRNGKLLLQK